VDKVTILVGDQQLALYKR